MRYIATDDPVDVFVSVTFRGRLVKDPSKGHEEFVTASPSSRSGSVNPNTVSQRAEVGIR